jgi:hypothetical protein
MAVFGMYNHVKSQDAMFSGAKKTVQVGRRSHVHAALLSRREPALRLGAAEPRRQHATFQVLSPKLILRSQFVTHEQVIIQLLALLGRQGRSPDLDPGRVRTHAGQENVFMVAAVMWW